MKHGRLALPHSEEQMQHNHLPGDLSLGSILFVYPILSLWSINFTKSIRVTTVLSFFTQYAFS